MFDLDFLYDHELCAVCILEGQFFFNHWKEKIFQMIGAAERSGYRSVYSLNNLIYHGVACKLAPLYENI